MNEPSTDETFAADAKRTFDRSVDALDGATLSQLNQGRHEALARLQPGSNNSKWRVLAPAGGIAAVALVALMMVRAPEVDSLPQEVVTDFEILMEVDSLEMYQDLEFYSWIEESDLAPAPNAG